MSHDLRTLVADELSQPPDPRVVALAATIAARYPRAARAVLFYGSCLREPALDGAMLDYYLIVSGYRAAYGRSWLAAANRLVPPNVFPIEADGLAAKYAVLSEADFARLCGPETDNPSVWARFAQPSRIVWAADETARETVFDAVAGAAPTLLARTIPILPLRGRTWKSGAGPSRSPTPPSCAPSAAPAPRPSSTPIPSGTVGSPPPRSPSRAAMPQRSAPRSPPAAAGARRSGAARR